MKLHSSGIRPTSRRTLRKKKTGKRKKQHGKGRLEHMVEWLEKSVQRAFPHFEYAIGSSSNDSTVSVGIYCPDEDPSSDVPSITFVVGEHDLFISTLSRCIDPKGSSTKSMNGSYILKKIIEIGEELKPLGIDRIRLTDASAIYYPKLPCSIPLAPYMILTSSAHHSWYNSYGFKSEHYEDEVKSNTVFSQKPMMELLYMIHDYRVHKKRNPLGNMFGTSTKSNGKTSAADEDALVQELMDTYQGQITPDMTIQEGIQRIHHLAQQAASCKSPIITFCQDAIHAALQYGIRYDNRLVRFL